MYTTLESIIECLNHPRKEMKVVNAEVYLRMCEGELSCLAEGADGEWFRRAIPAREMWVEV